MEKGSIKIIWTCNGTDRIQGNNNFDSWFSHDAVIAETLDIGYGVICHLKQGRVKYTYKDKRYILKQL